PPPPPPPPPTYNSIISLLILSEDFSFRTKLWTEVSSRGVFNYTVRLRSKVSQSGRLTQGSLSYL
ncbi:MAG: hypothetical protein WDZ56_01450, partial [Candidatus Paceibacterota bacterium]